MQLIVFFFAFYSPQPVEADEMTFVNKIELNAIQITIITYINILVINILDQQIQSWRES